MDWGAIRAAARGRLRDKVLPYYWSDTELLEFANDALREACQRARLLRFTDPVSVTANNSVCQFSRATLHLGKPLTFKYATSDNLYPLVVVTEKEYDDVTFRGVAAADKGLPQVLLFSGEDSRYIMWPVPDADGTVSAYVTRAMDDTDYMVSANDCPPIPDQYHMDLLYWIEYRAYSTPNSDSFDGARAATAEAKFDAAFGRRGSARLQIEAKEGRINRRVYPRLL